ncbi:helical backbone metal receptor [Oscillatoria amoena NRMC-F 0135]|nr:helical backbone metal receptor [Oscillatoria amoena NRMC-F 0135]
MNQRIFTDQLHNRVAVSFPPQRIISLVPSQTELLADLGLESRVVGITKFCVRPAGWLKSKTVVGGTKKFNIDVIRSLKPDLIIGNKEENEQEGIIRLSNEFPVWMSDVITLNDAQEMILGIGDVTDTGKHANELAIQINDSFRNFEKVKSLKVLYLIWKKPWMAAGTETFINAMLIKAGFSNALSKSRYPALTDLEVSLLNPEVIFLSSEPYPFSEPDKVHLHALVPDAKIVLVDGQVFSWYGSRLLKFTRYVNDLTLQLK